MKNGIYLTIDDDGKAREVKYDNRFDITIHCESQESHNEVLALLEKAKSMKWIPVTERLPDNANNPGAFCPRYQVMTEWGVTEGWYKPYDNGRGGCWYALIWFMTPCFETWNIDFERGDFPKVIGDTKVIAWRPYPEPYKEVGE